MRMAFSVFVAIDIIPVDLTSLLQLTLPTHQVWGQFDRILNIVTWSLQGISLIVKWFFE